MKKIQLFPNNVWISYLTTTSLVVSSVTKEKKIKKKTSVICEHLTALFHSDSL